MADPILHIKDAYYFEVPKFLARWNKTDKWFPEVWVRLDDDFQLWEATRLYEKLEEMESLPAAKKAVELPEGKLPEFAELQEQYLHWKHDHANHGKPLDVYLEHHPRHEALGWFYLRRADHSWAKEWEQAKEHAGGDEAVLAYQKDESIVWPAKKIEGYNNALHGKILIPQPFARLKNLYEVESGSGLGISKFMIIEVFVALVIAAVFIWLAQRVRSGDRPRGKVWNLLEAVLVFIRDQIARPAIDGHHDEGHGDHGHDAGKHGDHGHHAGNHYHEGDKFVPYLWTIFLFVLGCNLVGMFPWAGAPAASFSVTLSLAAATFLVGLGSGVWKFGVIGYLKNLVPSMDLPVYMAIPLLPAIFVIEALGLLIKHGVLGIRLLANIAAGHLVLVSLLALTFSVEGASNMGGTVWPFASVVVVLGATALSCLELFVAFLQAYVFTLLSALFIGAAVHRH